MMRSVLVLMAVAMSTTVAAKEGAKIQPVDKDGQPVGKPISLPDCRSCEVKQTGPNTFEVKVPEKVREAADKKINK